MGFPRVSTRMPAPTRTRGAVFAVGRLVHLKSPAGRSALVTLTDDAGDKTLASLDEGTEVAIVAWRPNGASGARYCVRTTDSGVEGWLPVANLRGKELPIVPPTPKPPIPGPTAAVPLHVGGPRASRPVPPRGTL
jgi:hypothetical protein